MNDNACQCERSEDEMLDALNEHIKRCPELMQRLGLVADGRHLLGPAPTQESGGSDTILPTPWSNDK